MWLRGIVKESIVCYAYMIMTGVMGLHRALILDMDGTMLDTERILIQLWDQVAREMGYVFPMEILVSTVGTTNEETREIIRAAYPSAPHDEIREEFSRRFWPIRERGEVPVKEGLFELLHAAKEHGMKIGVCTSTHRAAVDALLAAYDLPRLIDAMVCGGEAEHGKPDPAPYLLAAQRLGVHPEECIAVEDSPHGARSALDAGMTVAVIPDMVQPPDSVTRQAHVLDTLRDVISLFTSGS